MAIIGRGRPSTGFDRSGLGGGTTGTVGFGGGAVFAAAAAAAFGGGGGGVSRFFGGGDDRSRDDVRRFSTIFDSFFRFRAVNNDYTIVCASPRSPGKYRERGAVNEACGDARKHGGRVFVSAAMPVRSAAPNQWIPL